MQLRIRDPGSFFPWILDAKNSDLGNGTDLMASFWYFEGAVADGAHLLEIQRWRILLLQSMWTEARKKAENRIHLTEQVDTVDAPGMVKQILPSYGSFLQS